MAIVKSIGVVGGTPLEQAGIAAALGDESFHVIRIEDSMEVSKLDLALLIAVRLGPAEVKTVRRQMGPAPIVAVVDELHLGTMVQTMRAGASVAIPANEVTDALVRAVDAALADTSVMPIELAYTMACAVPPGPPQDLTPMEITLLRDLLDEVSIEEIAERRALSIRGVYRALQDLYATLGVEGRIGAVIAAARWNMGGEHDDQFSNA